MRFHDLSYRNDVIRFLRFHVGMISMSALGSKCNPHFKTLTWKQVRYCNFIWRIFKQGMQLKPFRVKNQHKPRSEIKAPINGYLLSFPRGGIHSNKQNRAFKEGYSEKYRWITVFSELFLPLKMLSACQLSHVFRKKSDPLWIKTSWQEWGNAWGFRKPRFLH